MKISILSIVYNNAECISDCIQSVINQDYTDVEHIVIDGGSTDGTQAVIEKYRDKIAAYVSEKDSGLYNALNKGIRLATGDVIGILHSDDLFFSEHTLSEIAETFQTANADLVYANGQYVDKQNISKVKRIYPAGNLNKSYLKFGWIPLHTTIYVRREVFEKYGLYDESYQIASDYEISLRWFLNDEIKKTFLDKWVVKMRLGGKSTSMNLQKRKSAEDLQIIRKYRLCGYFTLFCKIAQKIPQYLVPQLKKY
ncbi:glycosyl transferase [Bacteroidia bacterium]|nr:glycosyl transferase [Bacteroidia bacterium]